MTLGRSLEVYRGSFRAGGFWWYIGAILLAAGVANIKQGVGAVLLSALCGVVCLVPAILRLRQSAELFEGGVVLTRLYGTRTLLREHIRSVQLIHHYKRMGNYDEIVLDTQAGEVSIVGLDRTEQLALQLSAPSPQSSVSATQLSGWMPPSAGARS